MNEEESEDRTPAKRREDILANAKVRAIFAVAVLLAIVVFWIALGMPSGVGRFFSQVLRFS